MRISGQVFALGGIILIGSTLVASTDASAFGQQWRPAVTYPAAQTYADRRMTGRRVANVPSFRPRNAPTQRAYSATPTMNRYRTATRIGNTLQPRHVAQVYPMPPLAPPNYPGNSYSSQGWPGMSMWPNPFGQMVRAWQHPMPMFGRQFAWRPAEQPWRARQTVSYARPQQIERPAAAARYGQQRPYPQPRGHQYAQNTWRGQVWRPAGRAASNRSHANAARLIAAHRPVPSTFVQWPRRPFANAAIPAMPPRAQWRPDRAVAAAAYPADRGFRPSTYGKGRLAVAETGGKAKMQASDRLPGWVTTYQEPADIDACYWCSGS